jgi:hypothetical protein
MKTRFYIEQCAYAKGEYYILEHGCFEVFAIVKLRNGEWICEGPYSPTIQN